MEDNILAMFLEDTKEHLADIETDLLDIEEAGPDYDPELVNKVFRTAHSIKGSAGFLALDTIRDLSHKIESVLDMVRSREIVPDSPVVNVILRAFDRLQELVDNVQDSESMDISEHVAALTNLVTSHLPVEEQPLVTTRADLGLPEGHPIFDLSAHDLKQARKGGNYIYLVEYDLIHDLHKQHKTPLDLMRTLEKSGLILDCKTDIASVGTLDGELSNRIPFYVLYATILEPELCRAIFQVAEQYIQHIEEGETPATPPAPEKPRKAVSAADLDDLERQLDAAMAKNLSGPQTAVPPTPHHTLTEVLNKTEAPRAVLDLTTVTDGSDVAVAEQGEGFVLTGSGAHGTLVLQGAATIERCAEVKKALLLGLERCAHLTVELGQLKEADLSLLQLLFATRRSAKARNVKLDIRGDEAAPVLAVAQRAGFGHRMQDGFKGIFSA